MTGNAWAMAAPASKSQSAGSVNSARTSGRSTCSAAMAMTRPPPRSTAAIQVWATVLNWRMLSACQSLPMIESQLTLSQLTLSQLTESQLTLSQLTESQVTESQLTESQLTLDWPVWLR